MTVKDLIDELSVFNPDAPVYFGPGGLHVDIDICYGGSEGCEPENCDYVHMFIDHALTEHAL